MPLFSVRIKFYPKFVFGWIPVGSARTNCSVYSKKREDFATAGFIASARRRESYFSGIGKGKATMDRYALLVGGIMFVGEGIMKFFGFRFLGMDMPCGASLIIVGFGMGLFAFKQMIPEKKVGPSITNEMNTVIASKSE